MFYIPFPRLLELCWLLFSFKLYDSILGLVSHVNAQITHDPRTLDDVFLKEEKRRKELGEQYHHWATETGKLHYTYLHIFSWPIEDVYVIRSWKFYDFLPSIIHKKRHYTAAFHASWRRQKEGGGGGALLLLLQSCHKQPFYTCVLIVSFTLRRQDRNLMWWC